jgi:hypothetical protein
LTTSTAPGVPLATQSPDTTSATVSQRSADHSANNGINQKRHSLCSASPPAPAPVYQRSQSQVEPNQSRVQGSHQSLRHSMEMLNTSIEDEEEGQWSTEFARTAVIRKSLRENSHKHSLNSSNDLQNTCHTNEGSTQLHNTSTAPVL